MKRILSIVCGVMMCLSATQLRADEELIAVNGRQNSPSAFGRGTRFAMDQWALGAGILVVGAATAIVIATSNGTSSH